MTDANTTSIDLNSLVGHGASEWTLDPSSSSVEFHVKHFWGVMTVHGHFDTITGDGNGAPCRESDPRPLPLQHQVPVAIRSRFSTDFSSIATGTTGQVTRERNSSVAFDQSQ